MVNFFPLDEISTLEVLVREGVDLKQAESIQLYEVTMFTDPEKQSLKPISHRLIYELSW